MRDDDAVRKERWWSKMGMAMMMLREMEKGIVQSIELIRLFGVTWTRVRMPNAKE